MSLNDFLSLTTRGTFVLIAVLTLVDFLRHRDRARLDIALAFGALAAIIAIQGMTGITGLQAPWLSTIGALMLLAHPYLLLRLVQHFRPVRRAIVWVALGGMVASWAILIAIPTPMPTPLTLLGVAYFVYVESYAALAEEELRPSAFPLLGGWVDQAAMISQVRAWARSFTISHAALVVTSTAYRSSA